MIGYETIHFQRTRWFDLIGHTFFGKREAHFSFGDRKRLRRRTEASELPGICTSILVGSNPCDEKVKDGTLIQLHVIGENVDELMLISVHMTE